MACKSDVLYVANGFQNIAMFDTTTWSFMGTIGASADITDIYDVAVDISNQRVYALDKNRGRVISYLTNGSGYTEIYTGLSAPEAIDIARIGGKDYMVVADSGNAGIIAITLENNTAIWTSPNGQFINPNGIAFSPTNNSFVVADSGDSYFKIYAF
jgi:DNA-binding beta-propeller fold protein YncE